MTDKAKEKRRKGEAKKNVELTETTTSVEQSGFYYQWEPISGLLASCPDAVEPPSTPANFFNRP